MKSISTDQAPAAIGAYSQAVQHQGLIYASGQIALRPDGSWVEGDVADEARQALDNLGAVLRAAGSGFAHVMKTTIFLVDMSDFGAVNEVYAAAFGDHRPARECVAAAGLPRGARVEISCIAKVASTCC